MAAIRSRSCSFEDGSRVVYKPKDLRLDVAWHALIERLNRADAPIELKAVRAIARDGYGWTEFIDHTGCADQEGCKRFFRRAGAWLALFHCFAATDMHQENMIAAGDHPVPIDLETILQATAEEHKADDPEEQAFDAAMETVANSVMMVGLLPAYGRSPDNKVFAIGGMTSDWNSKTKLKWNNINSDEMRPAKSKEAGETNPNLPHVDGRYAKFGDHIDDFVSGFEDYAKFLLRQSRDAKRGGLFDGFAGLPVRKVIRPTRFYYMLLQRLKNHRTMDDGVIWSAQADFIARLAEWEKDSDPVWPLQRAERSALVALNVPHFVSPSDGNEIRDATGFSIRTEATLGPGSRSGSCCRASTSRISPGRSRSSGRIPTRFRDLPGRRRRVRERNDLCARTRLSRRARRFSSRKPTGSPQSCPVMPFAGGRAPPGSVSTGWATPRFSSSYAWVPTSTTAFPALRCFLPRMQR